MGKRRSGTHDRVSEAWLNFLGSNKDRPVMESGRFGYILPATAELQMRVTWQEGYTRIPTYLPVLLELYRVFGRRCSEFREFRRKHVDFDGTPDAPHGRLLIPRGFTKQDKRDEIELAPGLRQMLTEPLSRMNEALGITEGIGDTPLFPAPKDPSRPVRYATKMKDHPHQDEVAEIAGWKDQYSMRTHGYTQTDTEKRRKVIEESDSRG